MSKLLFAAFAIMISAFVSCNDTAKVAGESKDNSIIEKNLKADEMVGRAFETGDLSLIDSAVADDFVDHTYTGDKMGKDSLKASVTWVQTHLKGMKAEIIKRVADEEYVFSWMKFTGTTDGSVPGMPAGPYDMRPIEVSRFKDGKAVEHWSFMQQADMMKMMGNQKAKTDQSAAADTSKRK